MLFQIRNQQCVDVDEFILCKLQRFNDFLEVLNEGTETGYFLFLLKQSYWTYDHPLF